MRNLVPLVRTLLRIHDWDLSQPLKQQAGAISRTFLCVIMAFVVLHVLLVGLVGYNRSSQLFATSLFGCGLLILACVLIGHGWVCTGTWLAVATIGSVGLFGGWAAAYIGVGQSAWVFIGVAYCTLVLGFRAGALTAGLSLVAYAALAYAIAEADLKPTMAPHPFNQWLNLFTPSMVLLVAMGLIRAALIESVRRQDESAERAALEREKRLRDAHAAADGLERTVQDRTAALQLAVEDMQALTYLLSHDLMAKVSAIQGFANVLAEREGGQLSQDGRRRLGRIEANASELGQMIDGLLTYARASTLQPSLETVNVECILADIAIDMEQAHPGARIEWSVAPITSDRVMLRHILQNLVANACKFGGQPPLVRITAERIGSGTVLCVADNGTGFDAAEAQRLFELFHRAPGTDKPGHGVGLAVVKHLVERLGGWVGAESTAEGALFTVALPVGPSNEPFRTRVNGEMNSLWLIRQESVSPSTFAPGSRPSA